MEPALTGKGIVTYVARVPGLSFENVRLVERGRHDVCLYSERSDELVLNVTTNCSTVQEALDMSLVVASDVLDDLALCLHQPISGPERTGFCLKKAPAEVGSSGQYTVQSSLTSAYKAESLPVTLTSSKTLSLLANLPPADTTRKGRRQLYRAALNTEEPLARFMLLYGILLQICHDDQKKVDDCICGIRPETLRYETRSGHKETVFTGLRNRLGHGRPDWSVGSLVHEASTLVSDFAEIVAEAIG